MCPRRSRGQEGELVQSGTLARIDPSQGRWRKESISNGTAFTLIVLFVQAQRGISVDDESLYKTGLQKSSHSLKLLSTGT